LADVLVELRLVDGENLIGHVGPHLPHQDQVGTSFGQVRPRLVEAVVPDETLLQVWGAFGTAQYRKVKVPAPFGQQPLHQLHPLCGRQGDVFALTGQQLQVVEESVFYLWRCKDNLLDEKSHYMF